MYTADHSAWYNQSKCVFKHEIRMHIIVLTKNHEWPPVKKRFVRFSPVFILANEHVFGSAFRVRPLLFYALAFRVYLLVLKIITKLINEQGVSFMGRGQSTNLFVSLWASPLFALSLRPNNIFLNWIGRAPHPNGLSNTNKVVNVNSYK